MADRTPSQVATRLALTCQELELCKSSAAADLLPLLEEAVTEARAVMTPAELALSLILLQIGARLRVAERMVGMRMDDDAANREALRGLLFTSANVAVLGVRGAQEDPEAVIRNQVDSHLRRAATHHIRNAGAGEEY